MELLSTAFGIFYQLSESFVFLALPALGLIVIFSMMGVINMAHGEIMMVGAYTTAYCAKAGASLPVAVAAGTLMAGAVGVVLERLVIRRFYGQLLSSLVATWGLSLIMTQSVLLFLGPVVGNIPTPLGNFAVGEFSYAYYRMVLLATTLLLIVGIWALLRFTSFGLHARATMEDAEMARALGVDVNWMYSITFGLGSALAGIAGGMLAATTVLTPFFGQNFTVQAFITVIVGGGADIVIGLVSSALYLAAVRTLFTSQFNIVLGYAGMLLFALVIIRLAPLGISDWIEKRRIRGAVR